MNKQASEMFGELVQQLSNQILWSLPIADAKFKFICQEPCTEISISNEKDALHQINVCLVRKDINKVVSEALLTNVAWWWTKYKETWKEGLISFQVVYQTLIFRPS